MSTNALRLGACAVIFVGVFAALVLLPLATHVFAQEDAASNAQTQGDSDDVNYEDTVRESPGKSEADPSSHKTLDAGVAYTVTPVVANEKAKPRDILKKELVVTNNTQQRATLYITVRNIDPTTGDQVFEEPTRSDLSTSLANWIEITRGQIELAPGESRKIPYLIHVNLTAKPGSYFARIAFHPGNNRANAEARETDTELVLNLEVLDNSNERLSLGNFTSSKSVVLGEAVGFAYMLENVGNRIIEPRGSIRIFNRRGEEVGSVPLNAEGEEITPENKRQLAAAWNTSGRFGKYKAFLDLEYGENQVASVQDTVYFWVFPWKEMLVALVGVVVLAILGTYIVHMRAVARPVPARSVREVSVPETAPLPLSTVPAPAPAPASNKPRAPRPTSAMAQTVLVGRSEHRGERPSPTSAAPVAVLKATPTAQGARPGGATVELGSRSPARAGAHGSTVKLRSRR